MGEMPDNIPYTMDFSLFYRLDNLFYRLNNATLTLNLYLWFNLIMVLYKEIAPIIDEKDRKDYTSKMERLIPVFIELNRQYKEYGGIVVNPKLYKELQDLEIALRDAVNKRGIYLRKREDNSSGF